MPSYKFSIRDVPYALTKLLVAVLVLLTIGAYVWVFQKYYDDADKVHNWRAIPYYGLIILGAGVAYDCAKRVLMMPRVDFKSFGMNGIAGILWTLIAFAVYILWGYLSTPNTLLASYVTFVIGLLPLGLSNHYLSRALTTAVSGSPEPAPQPKDSNAEPA